MQTDATMLVVTSCARLHTLLHVVGCFCIVITEALPNKVGSVCTALPTLLGPRTRITHVLQSIMGRIPTTMHCRSQYCWGLLHLFAHLTANTHAATPNIVSATMFGSDCVRFASQYTNTIESKSKGKRRKL